MKKYMLPWRLRRAFALAQANVNALPALARRAAGTFRGRILVSTAFFGGIGGTEKHLKSLVESMPGYFFDIRARELRSSGFRPTTFNYAVNRPLPPGSEFDLYIYFAGGGKPPLEFGRFRFRRSALDSNGADVRDIENLFDHHLVQTTALARYCEQLDKCLLALPEVGRAIPAAGTPPRLPERYFLTVFNPFSDALKGQGTIYQVADSAALPIVWCYSDHSGFDFAGLPDHPNLVKRPNLSQPELYGAYAQATAYVSFSRVESFGWSLAEAFHLGLPIISREVGFLTVVAGQPGVHLYDSDASLRHRLSSAEYRRQTYDTTVFRDHALPVVLERIIAAR